MRESLEPAKLETLSTTDLAQRLDRGVVFSVQFHKAKRGLLVELAAAYILQSLSVAPIAGIVISFRSAIVRIISGARIGRCRIRSL